VEVQADALVVNMISAVRAELSCNSADLDLLLKLNAGTLEKADKMDDSLKSWSLLGEVGPLPPPPSQIE
jgi:hypothetical protein